jgi:hypothetical protein
MIDNINTNKKNSIIIFLLWPFFALIYAIRNYKASWAKDIIWFFVIFYGYTMTVHDTGERTRDTNRYRDKFLIMAATEVSFSDITATFYNAEEQSLDVIETIIIFLLSRVTNNYHILFALFGLIFGYFYSRNIWYLIDRAGRKIVPANIPIILTFSLIVGFSSINGFRFWTATHMFFYGVLPFLFEGKKKYLWISVISIFMHFSYIIPLFIFVGYLIGGNRSTLYFILFVATFFLKELDLGAVRNFLTSHLPAMFLPKVNTYTNTDYIEGIAANVSKLNWYVKLYQDALKWSVVSFLGVIFFTGKKFLSYNKTLDNLISFVFLLYSAANVIALLPSGGRFLFLANLFSVAFIFFYVQYAPRGKPIKRIISVAVPALALFTIVSIRVAFDTMGFFSVFGNPVLTAFINVDITLIELVKMLF